MNTSVIVKAQFEAIHKWENAHGEVAFLADYHRHVFHVTLEVEVRHDDREIEFILLKRALEKYLNHIPKKSTLSCEMMAKGVLQWVSATYGARTCSCSIFEDGENGAKVYS